MNTQDLVELMGLTKIAGGLGRMGGPYAAGPGGECVCPKCGTKSTHKTGTPCSDVTCPKCGAKMGRGE